MGYNIVLLSGLLFILKCINYQYQLFSIYSDTNRKVLYVQE